MSPLPGAPKKIGARAAKHKLLIKGWRGINHSFALVNQSQTLELLKLNNLEVFHEDLPFALQHWNRSDNAAGMSAEEQGQIDSLDSAEIEDVDCVYQICSPFSMNSPKPNQKNVTFMVTELGLSLANFKDLARDGRFFTSDNNIIVTPSSWSSQRIVEFGFQADKVHVIPHGVDCRVFAPLSPAERQQSRTNLNVADDEMVFLNVGLPTWNKGIDLLLLAFAELRREGRKVRLILKDQKDVYGLSVENMIRDLGASHPDLVHPDTLAAISVVQTNMSRENLRLLYGMVDCYVSPYRAEGFNLPVLEAIACGTPVIVTKGGATDDFCHRDVAFQVPGVEGRRDDDATGLRGRFIEPVLSELTAAMARFCEGGRALFPNFDEARRSITDTFTWERAAAQLAHLTVDYREADVTTHRHGMQRLDAGAPTRA